MSLLSFFFFFFSSRRRHTRFDCDWSSDVCSSDLEAQVSLTRDRSQDEYREVIESTVAECERLSRIVDSLLFLARAEAGDRQIHRSLFNGRAAVEKIAAYYQTIAEDRHVTITCTGAGEI